MGENDLAAVAMSVAGFNFEERLRLADEKRERQKAQNRERQRAWKERHQPAKLEKRWETALAALPDPERQALLALAARRDDLMRQITDVIGGIGQGRQAGLNMLFPDLAYLEVRAFVAERPLTDFPTDCFPKGRATDFPVDRCDDLAFREYGIATCLTRHFYRAFVEAVDAWCRANIEEADPAVASEVRELTAAWDNTPTPAPPLPESMSESERQGYVSAAESQRAQQEQTATEQAKWLLRNLGQHDVSL